MTNEEKYRQALIDIQAVTLRQDRRASRLIECNQLATAALAEEESDE